MKPLVSVILPCYMERENIFPLCKAIDAVLSEHPHEIIVVDDNSPDETHAALVKANYPTLFRFFEPIGLV